MRKILNLIFFVASSLFLVSCAKDIVDLSASITGIVKDYNTSEVLPNCQVTLGITGEATITGSDGVFNFNDVDPGTYNIVFKKAGYTDLTKSVTVVSGKQANVEVLLTAKSSFELSENFLDFGENKASLNVTAYNYSDKECNYTIGNVPTWATVIPKSGKINANGQTDISITIDRSLVNAGEHRQDLNVEYNNSKTAVLTIAMRKIELSVPTVSISSSGSDVQETCFCIVGKIESTGGSTVSKYGHCWSTHQNPSITDNVGKSEFGPTDENVTFKSDAKNLKSGTTYYVRSYAINDQGTAYSNEIAVQTKEVEETTTLSVSPSACTLLSTGSQQKISVTSNSSWIVQTDQSWLQISTASGNGNGSFIISAQANSMDNNRNATVSVISGNKTKTISVTQNGRSNITPSSCEFPSSGGQKTITVTSDVSWTAKSETSWIKLDKSSGNGTTTVLITAEANSKEDKRNGKVVFTIGDENITLSVTQAGASSIDKGNFDGDKKY